jgi:hypothetical protein
MASATGRDPHVLPENWCPLIRWYCDEMNVASASLTDNCVTMRSLHVLYPIGILAEHRYEVTLSFHGRKSPRGSSVCGRTCDPPLQGRPETLVATPSRTTSMKSDSQSAPGVSGASCGKTAALRRSALPGPNASSCPWVRPLLVAVFD